MQEEEYRHPRRGEMYDASDEGEEEALANDAGKLAHATPGPSPPSPLHTLFWVGWGG